MSVTVTVPPDPGQNRLWGIPWFGILARAIICIPQYLVLWVLGIVLYLIAIFVSWIPVLVNGRQADAIVDLFAITARIQARTTQYLWLVTGAYPSLNATPEHPIQVSVDRGEPQNNLWGIPFLGIFVRFLVCIPHFLVLWLLAVGAAFVFIVSWIPVLINGRQADAIVNYLSGVFRYGLRVVGYIALITGEYPPFRLSN